jgi:hypothetical protein
MKMRLRAGCLVASRSWISAMLTLRVALVLTAGLMSVAPLSAASPSNDSLRFKPAQDRLDARIEGWPLQKFLGKLVAATGWKIYVEPDTQYTISATFTNQPMSGALRRLLGNLNYALLPQTNGPPKFFVFRTSVHEATQWIPPPPLEKPASSKDPIPNELLVKLKPGSKVNMDRLAAELGARIVGRSDSLNAYRLRFEDADATQAGRTALEGNSDVAGVDRNYYVDAPTPAEGLALSSGFPLNLKPGSSPDHPTIGLIDTAVQMKGSQAQDFLLPSLAVVNPGEVPTDQPTHGTAMAETILRGLSQLPDQKGESTVRILPVDVYGADSATSTFEVANGVAAAVRAGATVINMSLGGQGDSDFLHQVIQEAHQQGILFFAGAGNTPDTTPFYPAAYPEVVAVTASDRKGHLADYANRGAFVDAVAPGTSLVEFNNQVFMVTGTSAATAYLSGLAAGLVGDKKQSPAAVEQQIRQSFSPAEKLQQP